MIYIYWAPTNSNTYMLRSCMCVQSSFWNIVRHFTQLLIVKYTTVFHANLTYEVIRMYNPIPQYLADLYKSPKLRTKSKVCRGISQGIELTRTINKLKTSSTKKPWPCFDCSNEHRDYITFRVVSNRPCCCGNVLLSTYILCMWKYKCSHRQPCVHFMGSIEIN